MLTIHQLATTSIVPRRPLATTSAATGWGREPHALLYLALGG